MPQPADPRGDVPRAPSPVARRLALAGFVFVLSTWAGPSLAQPQFEGDAHRTTPAGYAALTWSDGEFTEFELQRATTEVFLEPFVIYRGPDRGTFVSGLDDGIYHYRVRGRADGGWSSWSKPITLEVEHWSRARALGLMSLGAVVFILTAALIVVGHLRRDEDIR